MYGKMIFISGRMTCSSFYVTAFPNGLLLETPSYLVGGGVTILGRTYTYIMESRLAVSFDKVVIGKGDIRVKSHPGGGSSGHSWAYSLY